MGPIQLPPVHPHFPLISHHLQMKSLKTPCKRNLGPNSSDLHSLQRNDRAMIRCVCGVTIKEQVSSQDLFDRMKLEDMEQVPLTRRLRWHNHVERSDSWLKNALILNPVGGRGSGRPKKIWSEVIRQDCLSSSLTETHPSEGNRRGVHLEVCRHAGPYGLIKTNVN